MLLWGVWDLVISFLLYNPLYRWELPAEDSTNVYERQSNCLTQLILSSHLSSRKKSEKKLFVRLQTLLNKQTSLIRSLLRISFIHYFWRSIWIKTINVYTTILLSSQGIGLRGVSLWTRKNKKASHKERLNRTTRQGTFRLLYIFLLL